MERSYLEAVSLATDETKKELSDKLSKESLIKARDILSKKIDWNEKASWTFMIVCWEKTFDENFFWKEDAFFEEVDWVNAVAVNFEITWSEWFLIDSEIVNRSIKDIDGLMIGSTWITQ